MAYTHYWSFNQNIRGRTKQVEQAYQEALRLANTAALLYSGRNGGISGFSGHTFPGEYQGMHVNGSLNSGVCEDFTMREHYKLNNPKESCKTNRYSYDTVVIASLIILNTILGEDIQVYSDGTKAEWLEGLYLAREVLDEAEIPDTIRTNTRIHGVG